MIAGALVTRRPGDAIGRGMARLVGILLGMALALSLATGAVEHSAERVCLPGTEAVAEGHSKGDSDEAPHGDKGKAHHHGTCSGHHVAAPADGVAVQTPTARGASPVETLTTLGTAVAQPADLRPPIT